MNNIKLVAIDIGGTLITDDNIITKKNIETLNEIHTNGTKIALVTARMYSSTKYISNQINADYGVFGNGSCIIDLKTNEVIYSEIISKGLLKELIRFGKKEKVYIHLNRIFYELSDENKYFTLKHKILNRNYPDHLKSNILLVDNLEKYIDENDDVVKVIYVSNDNMDYFLNKFYKSFKNLYVTEYNKNLYENAIDETINYIEVGIKNNDKSNGILRLIQTININSNDVLVIGDGNNDIEMFKKFKNSGCLANGTQDAKKFANYISENDNNNSGLSEIIDYYIKKKVK